MIKNNVLTYQSIPIFVKCSDGAKVPTQNSEGDVGFDLYAFADGEIPARTTGFIPTGIQLAECVEPLIIENKIAAVPFLKVEGRSGMAAKGIFPVGGIVDPTYRGELKVLLFNSSNESYVYKAGDRVAQLVCYLTLSNMGSMRVKFVTTDKVQESARGDKGFGSSGA